MKKLLNSLFFFCLLGAAAAQPFSLVMQKLDQISFQQPTFIGKAGDHHVLIDRTGDAGAVLYIFSPSMQLLKTMPLPLAAYNSFRFERENGTSISWLEKQHDTVRLQRLILKEDGEPAPLQHVNLPNLPGPAGLLVNRTGNAYFYYTLLVDQKNRINIGGVLINDSMRIAAHVDGSIEFDAALERFTGPLLDANGNVQLVIYDKLGNYHESVDIRINTISRHRTEFMEETFHFDKIKLYDLLLSDNATASQLQLSGFFYNGNNKTISGIASIRLPYERNNQVTHTFSRFTQEQRDHLSTGMEYVRKHDDVFKFIKLRGIYNDNGNLLLAAWLLDIPQKKIMKDGEIEQHQNTESVLWLKPTDIGDAIVAPEGNAISRMPSNQGAVTPAGATNYWLRSSSWDNNSLYKLYLQPPPAYDKFESLQKSVDKKLAEQNLSRAPSIVRPKKFVFFSVTPEGKLGWMQSVTGEVPLQNISTYNILSDHFFFDDEQWRVPFYEIQRQADKRTPGMVSLSIASIGRSGMQKDLLLNTKPGQFYFSGLWKINETKYISAFKDGVTGESGFATLETTKRDTVKQ